MKKTINIRSFWIAKILFVAILLFFLTPKTDAQLPIQWQKSLGGSSYDEAYSVWQTTDGGYVLAGTSMSNDGDATGNTGSNYWIVRLDSSGKIIWQKSFGGTATNSAYSIQQTTDGGYVVAGMSSSTNGTVTGNHGGADYWILKLDSAGIIIWEKSFGGSGDDEARSVVETTDGGYIVAGWSNSTNGDVTGNHGSWDYWIVKIDQSGTLLWQKSLGGTDDDQALSINLTDDDGYIIAGLSYSTDGDVTKNNGDADYWVVKLDSSGAIIWQKNLGGSSFDQACSVSQTADGEYIVSGLSSSNDSDVTANHGSYDYWIVKLSPTGKLAWQKSFGGLGDDEALSIEQTSDKGYIVAGWSKSTDSTVIINHGSADYWILKLDSIGDKTWQESLGGSGFDQAQSIRQTADGGYIVAGSSNSTDGNPTGNHGQSDYWIVKLAPPIDTTTKLPTGLGKTDILPKVLVYPNPFSDKLIVEIESETADVVMTDALGRTIFQTTAIGKTILIPNVAPGTYFVRITCKNKIPITTKVIAQ